MKEAKDRAAKEKAAKAATAKKGGNAGPQAQKGGKGQHESKGR
jgi:hypothetical protein